MQLLHIALLFVLSATTSAKAICSTPTPHPEQIPRAVDCKELVEDLFAISKLEDDEKIFWSRDAPEAPGNRNLPFRFSTPSTNNDCEILVDTLKEGGSDTFSVLDVGLKAMDVVNSCLEPGEGKESTIGAEAVGKARAVAVFILRKIPVPTQILDNDGNRTLWQLPLNGTNTHSRLVEGLQA